MSTRAHHGRTVWAEPDELSGHPYDTDYLTTRVPLATFAFNRDRGSEPVPAGTVVEILETRPYGSILVREVKDAGDTLTAMAGLAGDGLFEVRRTA